MKVKGYLLSRYPSWEVYLYQLKISLAEGVPRNNDEHNTKAGPTVWVAQEAHGSVQTLTFRYQNRPFNSQFSLPTASVHCTECGRNLHDLLLTPFHCLKLDALLSKQGTAAAAAAKSLQSCPTLCDPMDCSPPGFPVPGILQARTLEWVAISFSKQGTHASILGAMLGGKQDCWWAGSISFSLGTVVIGFPYLWPLPLPRNLPTTGAYPALSITTNSQMRSCFLVMDISVPVPATSKYSFMNEVPCLAVKAQSSKTSIPIVTRAGTPSPCRGLWNGCQENTIMCWHENKYNSLT